MNNSNKTFKAILSDDNKKTSNVSKLLKKIDVPCATRGYSDKYSTNDKFTLIFSLFNINDNSIADECGLNRSTVCKYRNGAWGCPIHMKVIIARAFTKLTGVFIDSRFLWGSDKEFENFKKTLGDKK